MRSGETPSCISIGTMIAPISAHLAEAEPTTRLTMPDSSTMPTTVSAIGRPSACRPLAPLIASSTPRLDWPKA
ncbi:MAG: hypothetical protein A2579_00045 [Lysobacterales bacterium RIFOXYD1_FULL_69_11]|nr:MAG: hypothetical protein A2579_00045 [Xanthomonadales bacterium RIFOXYD1_FULL_69_11]